MCGRLSQSAGRFCRVTLPMAACLTLIGAGEAFGQSRRSTSRRSVGMSRPSVTGPSQTFDRSFGRIAGGLSNLPGRTDTVRNRQSDPRGAGQSARGSRLSERRRRGNASASGRAGSIYDQPASSRRGASRARSTLRGARGALSLTGTASSPYGYRGGRSGSVADMYSRIYSDGPLGLGPTPGIRLSMVRYEGWIQPGVVVRPQGLPSGLSGEPSAAGLEDGDMSLGDIVKHYVNDRRQAHIAQGWEYFQQGQYQKSLGRFRLADSVSVSHLEPADHARDLKARAGVKLALIHSGIAAEQYGQACNALRWLLIRDSRTGDLPDPGFLKRISDIRSRYGSDAMYSNHVSAVNLLAMATQDSESAKLKALRAFALWQDRGDAGARSTSLIEAQELANLPGVEAPWSNLLPAMEGAQESIRAETGSRTGSSASASASSRLPFELPETE